MRTRPTPPARVEEPTVEVVGMITDEHQYQQTRKTSTELGVN